MKRFTHPNPTEGILRPLFRTKVGIFDMPRYDLESVHAGHKITVWDLDRRLTLYLERPPGTTRVTHSDVGRFGERTHFGDYQDVVYHGSLAQYQGIRAPTRICDLA